MEKKILIIILAIALAGCSSYQSSLDLTASGEGIRYGLVTVKKGEIKIQKSRLAAQQKQDDQKYMMCLTELNQCVVESKNK